MTFWEVVCAVIVAQTCWGIAGSLAKAWVRRGHSRTAREARVKMLTDAIESAYGPEGYRRHE